MREPELDAFRERFATDWAGDLMRLDDLAPADALARARARLDAELELGLATPGHHFDVIVADGVAVGALWFSFDGERRVFLEEVEVHPEHRGRGIGARAMELLEARARALGARFIGLQVYHHNPRARALYERLGYVPTGVRMQKRLADLAG